MRRTAGLAVGATPQVRDSLHPPRRGGRWAIAVTSLATVFGAVATSAQTPADGDHIPNIARLEYIDPLSRPWRADSNQVVVVASAAPAFSLALDRTLEVEAGAGVLLRHTLTNVGEGPDSYVVALRNLAGDGYDVSGLRIVQDLDNDGGADPGEPGLDASTPIILTAGRSTSLLILGTVPVNESEGLQARLEISAVSLLSGVVALNVDTITTPLRGRLVLAKNVVRDTVEAGDSVLYTLALTNTANVTLRALAVTDDLPPGLTYEPGTGRLDGQPLADPAGGRGPRLTFAIGNLPPRQTRTLTYLARVERDAPSGSAVNRAQAVSTTPRASSNASTAAVRIDDGVFSDKGVIVGKVFLDTDRDRLDRAEPGLPGVRLFLEDGTSAITDSEGKFSFYGARPIAHVLKLDRTTLPAGAELIALDTRNASAAGSRFIDLKRGELHKANFAIDAADPSVVAEVTRRREAGEVEVAELTRGLRDRLEPDGRERPVSDPRALPASGTLNGADAATSAVPATPLSSFSSVLPAGTLTNGNSALPPAPVLEVARSPLEAFIAGVTDNAAGFVGLTDGDTVPGRQITVRVKAPLGSRFELSLNGRPVPARQLGKKVVNVVAQIEGQEFLGLDLAPGRNTLELLIRDSFGNERARVPLSVVAPDRLARLALAFSTGEPVADGKTPVRLAVALQDDAGTGISARTPLTLETSLGRWQAADIDSREPGTQVFIDGGHGVFTLLPPDAPGDARIVVSSGAIKQETTLSFLPDLRPMVASGVLEGKVFLGDGARTGISATSAADAFEEELREIAASDDVRTSGRAAFFLKGKIRGDLLLTAAYDSDKQTRERLFRDIEPDRYYPVYGDSSLRGYDAQSTRRLYVRVDRKKSYLLLGDFTTQATGEQRQLGNTQRSLNGGRAHVENRRVAGNAWVAHDTTRQVVEELTADGTSGPYAFRTANGLINSERVEILTRDRNQPSLVLRAEPLTRHSDYEFEPFTGRLLFREPVRALDENLNPRSIRITYEIDLGGDPFWTYGADAQLKLTEQLELGGAVVRDENPLDAQTLLSGNATVRLAAHTFLLGELAQSDTDLKGTGHAGRLDLRHRDARTEARLFYGQTESRFVNPGASLTPGRIEGGLRVTRTLNERNRLIVQGLITEDTASGGGRREGVRADVEHTFPNRVRLEVGARWSEETNDPAGFNTRRGALTPAPTPGAPAVTPFEVRSVRLKVTTPVPRIADAHVFGEYEQDVVEPDQRLLAIGGDWQFATRGRVYLRHEIISALGGPFELNQIQENNITVLGVETDYLRDGRAFTEYRARDAFSGREAEASTGLRNQFHLANGLRLTASVERITPFDGTTQNESTAVATGFEYTDNPLWKSTGRLELRWADTTDSVLNTFGHARKLSRDWTLLGKTTTYLVQRNGANARDSLQVRALAGLAWRQTDRDEWSALAKYEFRYEDGSPFEPTFDALRHIHIVSISANWQPGHDWIFSSRWAAKAVSETSFGRASAYFGQQANLRVLREISRHWDAGLNVAAGASRSLDRYEWAFGPEVGYSFRRNMRVGVGYNLAGFRDRDLAGEQPTAQGIFLNFRLKFDEELFARRHDNETEVLP